MSDVDMHASSKYTVIAHRKRKSWMLEVAVDGFSARIKSRHLDQATGIARKVIADRVQVRERAVVLDLVVDLPAEVHAEIARTREAFQRAGAARAQAALVGHSTADLLQKRGLRKRDIATLIGVSPRRAAKLLSHYKG